jgi:polyisoprenoid-binding protein YceI
MTRSRRRVWWVLGGIALIAIALIAGPFIYIHFIESDPAPRLHVSTTAPPGTTGTSAAPLDGRWKVTSDSTVGYRVDEVLFGQDNTATGRTHDVTGQIVINGKQVASGSFEADLTTVTSDESRRDTQFQGRIMDTAQFPTATFALTSPIALAKIPADGAKITANATGDLTLHGTTKSVTFPVEAARTGDTIQVSGSIPVTFADYGIGNPSFAAVTTKDHGELEFLLLFNHA